MFTYKLLPSNAFGEPTTIQRLPDGAFIGMSEQNPDYQAYLKWLEEGNTPEPADQGAQ